MLAQWVEYLPVTLWFDPEHYVKPDVVVHAYSPSTQKVDIRRPEF